MWLTWTLPPATKLPGINYLIFSADVLFKKSTALECASNGLTSGSLKYKKVSLVLSEKFTWFKAYDPQKWLSLLHTISMNKKGMSNNSLKHFSLVINSSSNLKSLSLKDLHDFPDFILQINPSVLEKLNSLTTWENFNHWTNDKWLAGGRNHLINHCHKLIFLDIGWINFTWTCYFIEKCPKLHILICPNVNNFDKFCTTMEVKQHIFIRIYYFN